MCKPFPTRIRIAQKEANIFVYNLSRAVFGGWCRKGVAHFGGGKAVYGIGGAGGERVVSVVSELCGFIVVCNEGCAVGVAQCVGIGGEVVPVGGGVKG